MSKWNLVKSSFHRKHDDLFSGERYVATFYNYDGGSWDYEADNVTGETRSELGTASVEIVPPAQDSTVDLDGTDLDFTTSIRFPESEVVTDGVDPLGEDERPTEVEIQDTKTDSVELYELHGYTTELGSGFIMCRLIEQ